MHWKLKGHLQKILGIVPGGGRLHHALQRGFGGLRNFDREFGLKMEDWSIMTRHLRDASMPIAGKHLFEIGSGWYPTFPLACHLGGAARVTTVDLTRHLKPDLLRACVDRLGGRLAEIAEACGVAESSVRARYTRLNSAIATSLDLARATDGVVDYRAPADATHSDLADASVDVIFSNSVLEHVPPDVVDGMFAEARRLLVPGGVMFHSVNCGDHYAYVDRNIGQLHYLRFSDAQWAYWNNAFLYQNRLRAHVFVDKAVAAGFAIDLDTSHPTERRMRELAAMPVHAQFADIPAERLCITTIDFIARQPGGHA